MSETLVVLVRAMISFTSLLIYTRVLGKQQISQLSYFDYIVGITIGSIAAALTTDLTVAAWLHWVGLTSWTLICLALQLLTLRWRSASRYVDGEPTVVIMNGKILDESMRKIRYRASDLLEQLRTKDVFDIGQVEFGVLETNGSLSVLLKSQYQPVTPADMGLFTNYKGLSTELIYDGQIDDCNLARVGLSRQWLSDQLAARGIGDHTHVFLALLDTAGNLFVDLCGDSAASIASSVCADGRVDDGQ